MAWIKTTEIGDWISWGQNTNTQKWIGRINESAGNGAVGAYRTEVSGGYIISTTVLTDGEWHHVTSVLESDGSPTVEDVKMYVDGALEAVSGFKPVGIDTVGGRNVWIGDGHHDRPWLGPIDDVRIYNRALTKLEIVAALEGVERVDMEIGFATPVIDGEVDYAWEGASTQYFVPLDDPANASGSWKALYDSENLYVIVDVTDDSLQNDSDGSWQDDSVELYFDGGNTKVDTPLSGDDHQYTFGWTTDEIQGTNIDGYTEGIEHAQVDTDTGWRIEIKMPWLSIQGAAPQARDLIGIDCYYNDDDDGGDSRENKLLSFSAVEGWNDASQWGTAVLGVIPKPVDPGTDGLVAFYALDGDASDSSGNELHGTLVGDAAFVEGQVGMALELDGDGDYVDGGSPPELVITEAISIACWVNPTAFVGRQGFAGLDLGYVLKVHEEGRLCFTTPGVADHESSNTILEAGTWQHVAATFLPGQDEGLVFYLNGVETERMTSSAINPGSGPFRIGNNQWDEQLTGTIDEVAIYTRILSADEILYLAGERAAPDVEANKEVARRFFEEMWNLRDLDIVEELISADMQGHAPTGEFVGYEGERQTILGTLEAFPDLQITIDTMIAEDNKVALLTSYDGTHTGTLMGQIPPTGAEVHMTGGVLFHFADGKIVEAWSFADMLGLMQQIGATSPPRPMPENYAWLPFSQLTGDPGDPATNKAMVTRFVEEVWNQRNLGPIEELFHPESFGNNPAVSYMYMPSGLEMFTVSISDYLTAYPDMDVTIHDMVAEGDKVLAHWTVEATHGGELMGIPPTGNPVTFSGHTMYRFADGQIVESRWAWDTMGMMQQITPAGP